jgi:4-amino-4-deoxy-L-arabinose transferase-like glycosyltransferase
VYYPPLVYWVTDVFYLVLGSEAMWVAILSNVVWLSMLVFATYGIGCRLWSRRVGWLSVAFVVASPMVITPFKEYMLDAPLTAISASALYLLIRSRGFASRRSSLLFGAAAGCGLLVKWTFPLALGLPVVHASATALAEARLQRRYGRLLNLGSAAALTCAIAGLWYAHNIRRVVTSLTYYGNEQGAVNGNPHVASPASALWYLWNLFNEQTYLLPFVFVMVGVVFCLRKRELAARNAYPILMVVGVYVLFTLLRHKDPRYTMPLLPPLAVVATSWIEYVSHKLRACAAGVLAVYAVAAFLAVSFGTSLFPSSVRLGLPSSSFGPGSLTLFAQSGYLIGPPTREQWHQEDVFRTIARSPNQNRTFAYRGPDTIWFNKHGLNYFALRYHTKWAPLSQATFLLVRGRSPLPSGFVRIRRWLMPRGESLALYKRGSVR